ncbi:MAG: efflux RND transporter periplasmic adaptor subunit [Betaproteobacteria bacterium]|nr:MAG: efflux RND transporter periplasmic adaptor subunit [Betaproteobacteria bacterium]
MPEKGIDRRWLAAGGIAAVVLAAVFVYHNNSVASAQPSSMPVIEFAASDLVQPQTRELRLSISITGTLAPRNWTTVKAKVAGELKSILVREGETVRSAQVLARIDPQDAQARLDEKIADLEGGRAQLALAQKNRANNLALLQQKFISQNAFDSVQSNYQVSEARLKALEAQVALAKKALADTVVSAPQAGIVSQRHAQPGEKLPVDGKILTLVDLAEMEVEAAVPAGDIPSIRVGQEVNFRVEGFGEREFRGRIDRINPATQTGSRSILVYALLPNRDGALKGGMFARGSVTLARIESTPVLPLSAVRSENGETFVLRIASDRLERQVVKLGVRNEDEGVVQILDGLEAQSRVVRSNAGTLKAGTAVKIAPTQN